MSIQRPLASSFGPAPNKKKILNVAHSGIKTKLNTGANVNNTKEKPSRRNELFKRITRTTLAALLRATAEPEESIYELSASDMLSVTTVDNEEERKIKEHIGSTDCLVLDVRDPAEFELCHIEGALCCPLSYLKQDKLPSPVVLMKNKPGKLVVLYGTDEACKSGHEAAVAMAERHWENVFLLTNGIKGFGSKFPAALFGDPPAAWGISRVSESSGRLSPRAVLMQAEHGSPQKSYGSSMSSVRSPKSIRSPQ